MIDSILLIDDDPIQNLINSKMIEKINVTENLIIAQNGQEALQKMNEENLPNPDIIFLDINMPVMDGWTFLDTLSNMAQAKQPKIYMLTSSVSPDDIKRSKEHGLVEGFITKPLSLQKLEFLANQK